MKIVLIQPWYDTTLSSPPLGLGYISSYLKQYNQQVKIIDGIRDNISSPSDIMSIVREIDPDVVGISSLSPYFNIAKEISLMAKKQGYTVVIGGVHSTFLPYQTLCDTKADFVCCGEGEIAWKKLALSNFENPTSIQGIYDKYSFKEEPKNHLFAEIIQNLDEIPFPDWDELKLNLYKDAPLGQIAKKFPVAPIMTSRGCAYGCTFCASPKFYQRKIRYRSPENVIAEIKYLIKKFNVKEWQTLDDNLIYNNDFAVKLCNMLIDEKINLPWSCQNGLRADYLNKEIAELMYKSGCYLVSMGVESANPQILKNVRKGETIEQISEAIKIANDSGMEVRANFILGLPGETKETIKETIDYAVNSKIQRACINLLQIIPGSKIYDDLNQKFDAEYESSMPSEARKDIEKFCNVTIEDLNESLKVAFRRFYLRPSIIFYSLKYVRLRQIPLILNRLAKFRFFGGFFQKLTRISFKNILRNIHGDNINE